VLLKAQNIKFLEIWTAHYLVILRRTISWQRQ